MAIREVEKIKPTCGLRWNGEVLEQEFEIRTMVYDGIVEMGQRPVRYEWRSVPEIELDV